MNTDAYPLQGLLDRARSALVLRADGLPARGVPIFARLWGRCVERDGCWEFTGTRNEDGYGTIRVDGQSEKAHRVAYRLAVGDPGDLDVLHRCDNPPCCNPADLFAGTNRDNMIDRQRKGRTKNLELGPLTRVKAVEKCPQGHPYSGNNVRYRKNGARRCAQCYRDWAAARLTANRDRINARRRELRAAKRSAS